MIIGLSLSYTWPDGDTASFWAIREVYMAADTKTGYLKLIPFTDQNTSGFPASPKWGVAKYVREIAFNITPANFPFAPGTDAIQKAYGFITQQRSNPDTGGIDWTTATPVTV